MEHLPHDNLPPILPVGTAVVLCTDAAGTAEQSAVLKGAVGLIISSPVDLQHRYRVRFPGGEEISVARAEIEALKHYQGPVGQMADQAGGQDLQQFVIYRCIVGSRAYGLDRDGSDVDRRGIYLPPAERHWSLYGLPGLIEIDQTQECYWELQRFLELALKANPTVLEVLHSPMVEFSAPVAEELLAMRSVFLTKLVYQTYNGYVLSQFKKLEADLRLHGQIKWKHAMHLIRLLLAGIVVLREGHVPVKVGEHRDQLLAIRDERMSWEAVDAWRLDLHKQFAEAFAETTLPDRPDYARVNAYLIRARRSMT